MDLLEKVNCTRYSPAAENTIEENHKKIDKLKLPHGVKWWTIHEQNNERQVKDMKGLEEKGPFMSLGLHSRSKEPITY